MQAGANMVKVEGGGWTEPIVRFLVDRGIPVCAHLGLTPQSVHTLGGYRIQGRSDEAVSRLRGHAECLAAAGAEMLVLELVPAAVGRELTAHLSMPVIGIGAGADCSGQVLVLHDMLGVTKVPRPRFVEDFLSAGGSVESAVKKYVHDVKHGLFPGIAHSY
jgi:3-methyl-2-oxobutanoate hydroxymethyltransferase